jgi:NitT/TauT family transport system permease protein
MTRSTIQNSKNTQNRLPGGPAAARELHRSPLQKAARRILVAAIWIAVWYLAWGIVQQEILIASPGEVLLRLWRLGSTGDFWVSTLSSLLRIVAGFLLAVAVGCALAVLCRLSSFAYDLFYPVIRIIRATPVASFIILALIWLNTGSVPVFASFLMVFPIVWENVYRGIHSADKNLLAMAKVFRLTKGSVARNVYIPSVMPYFIAACNIGIGMAWKAGIAAEILGVPLHSIGTELYRAKIYLETVDVFAWTAVVIALSVVIEKVFIGFLKKAGEQYSLMEQEG